MKFLLNFNRKKSMIMDYAVCFLFNTSLSKVLLQRKNADGQESRYNGVSKLLACTEDPIMGISDEIKRVLDITVPMTRVCTIERESLYVSSRGMRHNLYFFAGVIDSSAVDVVDNDGNELRWQDVDWVMCTPVDSATLTGEGDVQYAVRLATKILGRI